MRVFFQIAYWIMGCVQFFAVWDGFIYMWDVGSVFGFILAFFTAFVPILGSSLAMYGAMNVWDWGVLQSFILFFWYLILWGAVFGLAGLSSIRVR
jgi:hypothetical protein